MWCIFGCVLCASFYFSGWIFPEFLTRINWNKASETNGGRARARTNEFVVIVTEQKKNRKWNGNVEYVETQFIPPLFFLDSFLFVCVFFTLSLLSHNKMKTRTRIRLQLKAPKNIKWTKFISRLSASVSLSPAFHGSFLDATPHLCEANVWVRMYSVPELDGKVHFTGVMCTEYCCIFV